MDPHLTRPRRAARLIAMLIMVLAIVTGLGGLLLVTLPAHAAGFSVTDCSTYGTSAQAGTLAKALADATASSDPSDTITFGCDTSGAGLIFPSSYTVSKGLTLDATGHNVTLNGNDATRLFVITVTGALGLSHLTITHGFSMGGGGAIAMGGGALTITASTLSSNSVGAQGVGGGAIGAQFGNNSETPQISIASSLFVGNSAGRAGGAIDARANMIIVNSTFTGNTAGGGLGGGAIDNTNKLTLLNSTLAANSVTGDTIGSNLSGTGTPVIKNTIIAGGIGAPNCEYDPPQTPVDGGYNLDDGTSCEFTTAAHSLSNTDPKLGPLADNGGPSQTMALLGGSPAINAGNDAVCAAAPVSGVDQRGIARPQGAHCDMGAYEFVGVETSTTFSATQTPCQQQVTLSAQVTGGSVTPTGTVTFREGASTLGSATLTNGQASLITTALGSGSHSVTAAYSGDITYYPSASAPQTVTVGLCAAPPPMLRVSSQQLTCGQPLTLTAAVPAGTASGTITFRDGAVALGTHAMQAGTAQLTVTLPSGAHELSAVYASVEGTGVSAPITVTVAACQGSGGSSAGRGTGNTGNTSSGAAGTATPPPTSDARADQGTGSSPVSATSAGQASSGSASTVSAAGGTGLLLLFGGASLALLLAGGSLLALRRGRGSSG